MSQKKDTTVLTLALLCAIAAAEQPAVASMKFAEILAQTPTPTAPPTSTAVPSATQLRISSSSSMEQINTALKQSFEQQFPSKQVTIEYGDATAALRAVRQEKADLAAIGRPLTKREKARGLVAVPVSRNKIAIVVGENNPFTGSLTDQQFAKIFRGEISNWSELGGAPGKIRVIDRPPSSDTRQALSEYPVFQRRTFDTGVNAVRLSEDSTKAVIRELGTDGISIAIADQVLNQPGVRVLQMHKTTPDNPKYPFSQPLFYVYKKTNNSPALQSFLSYAATPSAQNAIAQAKATIATVTPGVTPSPAQLATPGATPMETVTIPGTTPSPAQLATPGAIPTETTTIPGTTPSPAQLATPGAIPTETTTIPGTTPSSQTTAAIPAAGGAVAATPSQGGWLGNWGAWIWPFSLLLFLFLVWLQNKRKQSEPKSNQHLSLSHLDRVNQAKSSTADQISSTPTQKSDLLSALNESQAVKSDPAPIPTSTTEKSTSTPSANIPASAIASGAAIAASGLVAGAISDSSDVSPSQSPAAASPIEVTPPTISDNTTAVAETTQEFSAPETSITTPAIAPVTELATSNLAAESAISDISNLSAAAPPISDITTTVTDLTQETFTATTPAVTEETDLAKSDLAAESAISDSSALSQPTVPPATNVPEEPTKVAPSVTQWTAIASGLVAGTAIAAAGDSQPTEAGSTPVSEITSDTPATQTEAEVPTSGIVTDRAFAALDDYQASVVTPAPVPEITSETAVTEPEAIGSSTGEMPIVSAVEPVTADDSVASPESSVPISEVSGIAPESTTPSVSQLGAIASGLVAGTAFAAAGTSQPTEATSAISEITSDTTQAEALGSSTVEMPIVSAVEPVTADYSVASPESSVPISEISGIAPESTTPSVSQLGAIASGLVAGTAFAAAGTSQPTEAGSTPVSEITSDTPATQTEAEVPTSGIVTNEAFAAVDDYQASVVTPAPVPESTSETAVTELEALGSSTVEMPIVSAVEPVTADYSVASSESSAPTSEISGIAPESTTPSVSQLGAISPSGLVADATATDNFQPLEATPAPVSEITSDTPETQPQAIASGTEEIPHPSDLQPLENDSQPIEEAPATTPGTIGTTAIAAGAALAAGAAMLSSPADQESDRQEVEAAKFDPTPNESADLATASTQTPEAGEQSSIVLLSREPEWAYAQWTIAKEQKDRLCQLGCNQLILRLYDVTDVDLNNQQPQSIQQNICNEDSQDAYVVIPTRDRDYMVEIGYAANGNPWVELARSSVVRIPPPSAEDVQLADVEFEAVRLLSTPPVSPEILSSSAGSLGSVNLLQTDTSAATSPTPAQNTSPRKFRLLADAELSFYGETEPDAQVTINGRPIELDANGIFRCQMLFPDGTNEYNITALAANGETYSIQIKFTRETQQSNE